MTDSTEHIEKIKKNSQYITSIDAGVEEPQIILSNWYKTLKRYPSPITKKTLIDHPVFANDETKFNIDASLLAIPAAFIYSAWTKSCQYDVLFSETPVNNYKYCNEKDRPNIKIVLSGEAICDIVVSGATYANLQIYGSDTTTPCVIDMDKLPDGTFALPDFTVDNPLFIIQRGTYLYVHTDGKISSTTIVLTSDARDMYHNLLNNYVVSIMHSKNLYVLVGLYGLQSKIIPFDKTVCEAKIDDVTLIMKNLTYFTSNDLACPLPKISDWFKTLTRFPALATENFIKAHPPFIEIIEKEKLTENDISSYNLKGILALLCMMWDRAQYDIYCSETPAEKNKVCNNSNQRFVNLDCVGVDGYYDIVVSGATYASLRIYDKQSELDETNGGIIIDMDKLPDGTFTLPDFTVDNPLFVPTNGQPICICTDGEVGSKMLIMRIEKQNIYNRLINNYAISELPSRNLYLLIRQWWSEHPSMLIDMNKVEYDVQK